MSERVNTAADFLKAATLAEQDVPLPNGAIVRIRELSLAQRGEFQEITSSDPRGIAAWLIYAACVTSTGDQMFDKDDVEAIMQTSPQVAEVVGFAVMRLSGLTSDDDDTPGKDSPQTGDSDIV